MKSSGSLSCGWSPNSTDIGWDTTSRHYRRCFKSTAEGWGEEPLKGTSPRTSIACVLPWEKAKFMGRHSPRQMSSTIRSGGVAYGWSTGVHEVATLFALTQNPCQKWEDLGYGKAALIYQRTQQVLKAARLLPAHRRLPHQAFLSGLWWKLLSLQPLRLLAYLPGLGCLRPLNKRTPSTSQ